jgi:serine/threonine-protein kinase CHEK2
MCIVDLIDSMLIVDAEKRYSIDQCLSHPWLTQSMPGINDSTNGLVGGIQGLDMNRRGVTRERTMLSTLNSVQVTARIPGGDNKQQPVKIFAKNKNKVNAARKEAGPSHQRDAGEFIEMGGKGDEQLYGNDGNSVYSKADIAGGQKKGKGGR